MFKNENLFDGEAGRVNEYIKLLNMHCNAGNYGVKYDAVLCDAVTEDNVENSGWLDCINLKRNGEVIANYLTCTDILNWVDGFLECLQIAVIEQ